MKQLIKSSVTVALASLFLAACDSDDKDEVILPTGPAQAVVQTVAPDYSSSEAVVVDAENEQVLTGFYAKSASDYTLTSYAGDVYHIGRRNLDTIDKYSGESLDSLIWSYSTQDDADTASRNPYSIVFASAEKAYVIRYDSENVWIVNPSATVAEDFKIGEIDTSAYAADEAFSGDSPRPTSGLVKDDKFFLVLQRTDANWSAHTPYVAVFDVDTDEEIETNASTEDSVKGIPLTGINPLENSIVAAEQEVFVISRDSYSNFDFTGSKIEAIDVNSYALRSVVEGADVGSNIHGSVIVDESKGYFYTTAGGMVDGVWTEMSTLYEFNPTTGEIVASNVAGSGEEDINFIALDSSDFLWISVAAAQTPGIDIVDTADNSLFTERLLTDLNPAAIVFIDAE